MDKSCGVWSSTSMESSSAMSEPSLQEARPVESGRKSGGLQEAVEVAIIRLLPDDESGRNDMGGLWRLPGLVVR